MVSEEMVRKNIKNSYLSALAEIIGNVYMEEYLTFKDL